MTNFSDNSTFSPASTPHGISFAEWTCKWWKWLHSMPRDTNAASDTTGQFCGAFQPYPDVWLLAGTFGGSVTRNCTIPYGRSLLFPIITSIFSFTEDPEIESEEQLVEAARKDMDTIKKLKISVDGKNLENADQFRVRSNPFRLVVNGIETIAVSDGFWIFLKQLDLGTHIIYFLGENLDFSNEVTYNISIVS